MPHRKARNLEPLLLDFRQAVRALLRDRAFTFAAIGTLTLAIALNVAGFTLMQTMLVRGYPLVDRNDRLVYVQERGALGCCVAYGTVVDWRAEAKSFEGMAYVDGRQLTLRDDAGGKERFAAAVVSADLFQLLGVQPVLGRNFAAADEAAGAAPVAILSHGLWQSRFGGSADVIGETLATEDVTLTVIGVMPEGFSFPEHQDLWMPVPSTLAVSDRTPSGFLAVARLADGATVDQARAELPAISQRLADEYPDTNRGVVPDVQPYAEFFFGSDAKVLYGLMWIATWFVLLIACANLANLSVARTMRRAHEIATRLALGAGFARMGRQMLIENALLAIAAAAGAWWLAKWSITTYAAATASVHYVLDFSMGRDVLVYLGAIALAACLLFTLVPVVSLRRIDSSDVLKGGARGLTPALSRKQAALIVGQMIFAVVLLSGSGVLVRSFMKFESAQTGIDAENVVVALVALPDTPSADAWPQVVDAIEARLEAIAGVELATATSHRPLRGALTQAFEIEGQAVAGDGGAVRRASVVLADPGYFRAVGAAVLLGRDFTGADLPSSTPVAIVNERFAELNWPGDTPLGKRVRLRTGGEAGGEWLTVVGVASNIMQADPTRQSYPPLVYRSQRQVPASYVWALAKTALPPSSLVAVVRRELQSIDPAFDVSDVAPLADVVGFDAELMDVAHQHLGRNAVLFPIFAGCALLLAAVGLYAVISQSVGRRTREIGVRMALGATAAQIWRGVLRQGMAPVVLGLVVGLAVSLGVNRLLQSQLIGVAPYDLVTMGVASAVLVLLGVLACRVPARRAMSVDPAVALRRE